MTTLLGCWWKTYPYRHSVVGLKDGFSEKHKAGISNFIYYESSQWLTLGIVVGGIEGINEKQSGDLGFAPESLFFLQNGSPHVYFILIM